MPIRLVDIDTGRTQYGTGSFLMLGDRPAAGASADLDNISDFHRIRYNFESAELAGNAPGIEVPIIGDTPSEFPFQQGQSYSGFDGSH